jgi:ADP-dependent NAD(P)H-hydrate dehydratase / NAD(P)H-hydrate epimerase
MWIATAERTRILEEKTELEFGITAPVLMERAGMAVFDALRQLLPDGGRVAVVCGKGHNGGDGLVTARYAAERNFKVDLIMACGECELAMETERQVQLARNSGLDPIFPDDARWQRRLDQISAKDVIIDALLGIGAKREVHGHIKAAIQAINRSGVPVISVDVPSGICCDTGEELGESVWALRTVTFGMAKPYLFQGIGLEHAGYWTVAEIGLPQILLTEPTESRLLDGEWVASLLPERLKASHKGDNGHVLIIAGSKWMRGAATLAAMSAMNAGAGLVTVAGIETVCAAVSAQVPEALLLPLPEIDGVINPDAINTLMRYEHKFTSILVGPGLSTEAPVQDFLNRLFRRSFAPMVIDADALNAVAAGVELPDQECVLTPHPGEISRLLHCSIAEVQADRFRTLSHAVGQTKQCVLLKGPYSIVGEPGQPMLVNCTGNPGQASAGMGDVLGGMIATLMAQDLPGYYSAGCSMFWHGAAADLCTEEIGPIGYKASDVARMIPHARSRIMASCSEQ